MSRQEFDEYAQTYEALLAASIVRSGEPPDYFAAYRVRDLRGLCDTVPSLGPVRRVLDFGSGIGGSIAHFGHWFPDADLICVDASLESLAVAAGRHPGPGFVACDGRWLPFGDATFDCVFVAGVIHHVPSESRIPLFAELRRVLRAGGLAVLFEHNPLNPLTVQAVRACPFDDRAELIGARALADRISRAGFRDCRFRYRMFFPHALRALRPLERWLGWLPLGAQYYLFARR